MADDEAQALAAARALPLEERVAHKNWKARSEAWEQVKEACDRALGAEDPALDEAGAPPPDAAPPPPPRRRRLTRRPTRRRPQARSSPRAPATPTPT
jgi:hypothetical protein